MTVFQNKAFNYHHNFIPNKSNVNVNTQQKPRLHGCKQSQENIRLLQLFLWC